MTNYSYLFDTRKAWQRFDPVSCLALDRLTILDKNTIYNATGVFRNNVYLL